MMNLKKQKGGEARMEEKESAISSQREASSASPPPPPPYLSTGDATSPLQQMQQGGQKVPRLSLQSYHSLSPCRTLQTYNANKKGTEIRISEGVAPEPIQGLSINDTNKSNEPYIIHLSRSKPHMRFISTITGQEFATANVGTWKCVIEISFHGQSINLSVPRSRRKGVTYTSSSLPSSAPTLIWQSKHTWRNLDFMCLRSEGGATEKAAAGGGGSAVPLARFRSDCWSWKKAGTVELFSPLFENDSEGKGGIDGAGIVEEVLAIGLTMIQYERVQTNTAAMIVAIT